MQALLKLVRRLLSKEQRRFLKFCLVGASGVPVNLLFTWLGYRFLFQSLGASARTAAASLCGILVSIFTNFLLNDLWTWGDREKARGRGPILARLGRFYLVCSIASAIQFGTAMALGVRLRLHYLLAQLCGIGLAMAVNFVVNNAWTFRPVSPPPDSPSPTPPSPAPSSSSSSSTSSTSSSSSSAPTTSASSSSSSDESH